MHKYHACVPFFGVQKAKSSVDNFCSLFAVKQKCIYLRFCGLPITFFQTLIKLPNSVLMLNDQCWTWFCVKPWCTPWIECTREMCFLLYRINRSKVAQYFSARSKYGVRRAPWPNFNRKIETQHEIKSCNGHSKSKLNFTKLDECDAGFR